RFDLPGKATHVEINPEKEILDLNRLNNSSSRLPKVNVELIPKFTGDRKPIDAYAIRSAPYLYFNGRGYYAFGWTLLGSFMERDYRLALGPRIYSDNGLRPGFAFQYHTVLDAINPWLDLDILYAK